MLKVLPMICALLLATAAQANDCTPGDDIWVTACSDLSTTAQWDEQTENDCTYNPPPGYVVLEAKEQVISSNSGSRSVNVIAGGSNFATSAQFQAARDNLLDGKGTYFDSKFSGSIENKFNNDMEMSRKYEASNNTVYATVSASGSGNQFNRTRGWEEISVAAHLLCIGAPDVKALTDQAAKQLQIPFSKNIQLKVMCDTGLTVSYRYMSADSTLSEVKHANSSGEYELNSGETPQSFIYVYSETQDKKKLIYGDPNNTNDLPGVVYDSACVSGKEVWKERPVTFKRISLVPFTRTDLPDDTPDFRRNIWRGEIDCPDGHNDPTKVIGIVPGPQCNH